MNKDLMTVLLFVCVIIALVARGIWISRVPEVPVTQVVAKIKKRIKRKKQCSN